MSQTSIIGRDDGVCFDSKNFIHSYLCASDVTLLDPYVAMIVAGMGLTMPEKPDVAGYATLKAMNSIKVKPDLFETKGNGWFDVVITKQTSYKWKTSSVISAGTTGTTVDAVVAIDPEQSICNIPVGSFMSLTDLTGALNGNLVENVMIVATNATTNELIIRRNPNGDPTVMLPSYPAGTPIRLGLRIAQLSNPNCTLDGCDMCVEQDCCVKHYLARFDDCVGIDNNLCSNNDNVYAKYMGDPYKRISSEVMRKFWMKLQNSLLDGDGAIFADATGRCATANVNGLARFIKDFTLASVPTCCVSNWIAFLGLLSKTASLRVSKSRSIIALMSSEALQSILSFQAPNLNITYQVNPNSNPWDVNGTNFYGTFYNTAPTLNYGGVSILFLESEWMTANNPGKAAFIWTDSLKIAYQRVMENDVFKTLTGESKKSGGLFRMYPGSPQGSLDRNKTNCISSVVFEMNFQVFMECVTDNFFVSFPQCDPC